jgi:hypothetical protein
MALKKGLIVLQKIFEGQKQIFSGLKKFLKHKNGCFHLKKNFFRVKTTESTFQKIFEA